ncbi:hypothetical protein K491DRAFT_335627 [Lophiostoma macrostomum CBS 122681]|uniref:Uncharacterized protein n=1 Tax=Lophiostoma macrostomum CBS 122681 TaxID=1314788 RepID=A0A6A6TTJ1_9PLEO|nr:hypothetical protein K491DRAFT_335627 [Lophiostoma macrostomum CBS 122681]
MSCHGDALTHHVICYRSQGCRPATVPASSISGRNVSKMLYRRGTGSAAQESFSSADQSTGQHYLASCRHRSVGMLVPLFASAASLQDISLSSIFQLQVDIAGYFWYWMDNFTINHDVQERKKYGIEIEGSRISFRLTLSSVPIVVVHLLDYRDSARRGSNSTVHVPYDGILRVLETSNTCFDIDLDRCWTVAVLSDKLVISIGSQASHYNHCLKLANIRVGYQC